MTRSPGTKPIDVPKAKEKIGSSIVAYDGTFAEIISVSYDSKNRVKTNFKILPEGSKRANVWGSFQGSIPASYIGQKIKFEHRVEPYLWGLRERVSQKFDLVDNQNPAVPDNIYADFTQKRTR